MRTTTKQILKMLSIGLVVTTTFVACGDSESDDDEAAPGTAETKVSDPTATTTAKISDGPLAGTSATFPAGSLAAGTIVVMNETTVPDAFSSVTDAPAASSALSISAKSSSGEQVATTTTPFTLAIAFNDTATTLLDPVDKSAQNVCVFHADTTAQKVVYRAKDITVATDTASIQTSTFGVYQVVYCGDLALDGFKEANGSGTNASANLTDEEKAFFDLAKGDYKLKAVDTNATGDGTWLHGTEYTVNVAANGVITVPTASDTLVVAFGEKDEDKFASNAQEANVSFVRDGVSMLLGRSAAGDVAFKWQMTVDGKPISWSLNKIGPTGDEGPLGAHSAGKAVKTHSGVVSSVTGSGGANMAGDEFTFVVNVNGSVVVKPINTTFTYVEGETEYSQVTSDDGMDINFTWYKPNNLAPVREMLSMRFKLSDGTLVSGTYRSYTGGSPTFGYQFTGVPD